MQVATKNFPQIKLSTSIILALMYTALIGMGMANMYFIEGVSYGSPEMVYTIWWAQLILTIFATIVAIKFFGIGMGLGAFRPVTGESKNIIFIFLIIILLVAIQFVYGIDQLNSAQIEGLLYTLLVVSMVGFAEEVMFRGIVFRAMYTKYGPVGAILGSSVMFSLLHAVNVFGGLPLFDMLAQLVLSFIFGLGLGYLTYRVNHLLPAIIFHLLWNFFALGTLYVEIDMSIDIVFISHPIVLFVAILGLIKINRASKLNNSFQGEGVENQSGTKSRLRKVGLVAGAGVSVLLTTVLIVLLASTTVKKVVKIIIWNSVLTTEFKVEGNVVYMNNLINSRTYDQFVEILEQNPGIDTLIEETVPGSLDDDVMIELAYLVRERGINTHLLKHSKIDSGGVDLFLAGLNRTMERGAHIGVHSWVDALDNVQASEIPRDDPRHELNRKYIEDMLGYDNFYWFTIYAAPADGIYEMSEQEIIDYGLITEPIVINETSTRMSGMLADKVEVMGNPNARDVYIYAQGGPTIEFNTEEALDVLVSVGGLNTSNIMLVAVQQIQTVDPWRFTEQEIDFQQAINYNVESMKFMAAAIQFYKERGHRVYAVGVSFGAFVVQDTIASYGNIADGYIILVGRLDIEPEFWQVFAEGNWVIFEDGNIIPDPSEGKDTVGRNRARLAAGFGYRRYTELLADIPLQNVVYGFGTLDQHVGSLTKAEIDFLLAKNAMVLSSKAGHGEAVISLIAKAIKDLQAKQAVLNN